MTKKRKAEKRVVFANWKMNPTSLSQAKRLFLDVRTGLGKKFSETEVIIASPMPYLNELQSLAPSGRIKLAAQDVYHEKSGAFTGEVSLPMLKSVGVGYVLVGHSEKRAAGETDLDVYKNVQAVVAGKTVAVICVGEKSRDRDGNYFGVVEAQIKSALKDLKPTELKYIMIAYEPIWAISSVDKSRVATPEDIQEMKLFIQKVLSDCFSRSAANRVPILYGGSVNKKNAEELISKGDVDGFLVGGASLRATEFLGIINIVENYVKTA